MAKTSKSAIEADLVRTLANLLEEAGLSEIEYSKDGLNIRVVRPVLPPSIHSATSSTTIAESALQTSTEKLQVEDPDFLDHPGAVTSPMVGVVYTSPDPGSPPFVRSGDRVSEGQTLFLIEAMKVFNPIAAPKAGTITRILVETEMPVEFGEPLALIE